MGTIRTTLILRNIKEQRQSRSADFRHLTVQYGRNFVASTNVDHVIGKAAKEQYNKNY